MCHDILSIYHILVKEYHECSFSVEVGERFVSQKKRGDCGNALKVINAIHDRAQLCNFTEEKLTAKPLSSPMSSPNLSKNMEIDDNRCQSMTINDNRWQSIKINGN